MKNMTVSFAALVAATFLPAQDPKTPTAPPNPKTPAHEALAHLVGDWQDTCKMAAMPGVPGMEKATESTGTEHAELICNGLWLKSTVDSTYLGKPFQGVRLVGYDPFAQKYQSIWVSTQDEPACVGSGTFDEKTKTWTFTGNSPKGAVRSQHVFQDADNSTETCYLTGPDGKETQCMQVVRKRGNAAAVRDASAAASKPAGKELALLAQDVGNWNCTTTCTMGGKTTEEKCTDQVLSICDGKWIWSNFKGTAMGQPYEGHALTGWDNASKQYVCFWIDSSSATLARVAGANDETKKQITFAGSGLDEQGKSMTIHQVYTHPDADTRILDMTMQRAQGPAQTKITYKRAK